MALLPLPRRRLAAGLLAASSVGIGGAGTAVVLAVGLPQIFNLLTRRGVDALEAVGGVVAWTPPALAAQAPLEVRAGDLVAALLALAGAVATIGLLAWLWMASLDRSLTTASVSSTGSSRRAAPGLFPSGWAWLPRDRRGAVAAKELRYYGRDPRARAGTLIVVIFALALPIVVAISGWGRQPESVLAVGVLAAWVGLGAINQYGIEAGAYCGLGRRRRGPPGGQEPGVRRVGPRRGDASGPGPGGRDRRVALGASGRAHQRGRPGRGPGGGQRGLCPCSWPPWYWGWVLLEALSPRHAG